LQQQQELDAAMEVVQQVGQRQCVGLNTSGHLAQCSITLAPHHSSAEKSLVCAFCAQVPR
jgi:hypothetical protein